MRNFYLFEPALTVNSIQELEDGINNLNTVHVNRDPVRDSFIRNDTIWECDTTQGIIYEMFYGIVNEELQRLIPILFNSFLPHEGVYTDSMQIDEAFPKDCNAFTSFDFSHSRIERDRQVNNQVTYRSFVLNCLKYGIIENEEIMGENLALLYPFFIFSERAIADAFYWKRMNIDNYKKLFTLFDDISEHPFMGGVGQTEVLIGRNGVASKRITQEHRITYHFAQDSTQIFTCQGHY